MNKQHTILIVGAPQASRDTLAEMLQQQGYTIVLANQSNETLELSIAYQPNSIIIIDEQPNDSTFNLYHQLRRLWPEKSVILISTPHENMMAELYAIEVGSNNYTTQPMQLADIGSHIEQPSQPQSVHHLASPRIDFARMIELSPNGILVLDKDGTILLANLAIGRMLNLEPSAMVGQSFYDSITPDQLSKVSSMLNSVIEGNETSVCFDSLLVQANGHRIPVGIDAGYFDWHMQPAAQLLVRDRTERHQAEAHTRRQIERFAALHAIDTTITSSLDLNVTLRVILDHLVEHLQVDAAAILLRRAYTQTFEYTVMRGVRRSEFPATRLHLGEGCAGQVALQQKLIRLPNDYALISAALQSPLAPRFPTYFGIPLIVKGQVEGVLEVYHHTALAPEADWFHFLETLAGQASLAIDHANILQSMHRSNVELMHAYDTTLEGWARALELRDKETEGHAQRVTELTVHLAKHMGVNDEDLTHIRRGALLHDIGKMGIPDSILLKPGPLSKEEWEIMRQHPTLAYNLLAPVSYLRMALDIPYCHHEKWDGTGYPRGLKGEQIPLAARIFSVVDIWDALRFDRPYRKGWRDEEVREYIRDLAGSHFDPQVVKAFLELDLDTLSEPQLKLLLVDDDTSVLEMLRRTLHEEFTVFTASTGTDALDILAREEIALIIVDQRMPHMTGIQLLERAKHVSPSTLSILCSAYFDNTALSQALNLGTVRGFISKPWSSNELRRRVNEVVRQYRAPSVTNQELFSQGYKERYVR
jgi:PAS domain S-box-containing protein